MNIDKIENLKLFPSYIKYLKEFLTQNVYWVFFIMFFLYLGISIVFAFISIIIISIFEYYIDREIFSAFEKRRNKKIKRNI